MQLDTLSKVLRVLNINVKLESPLMERYAKEAFGETS